MESEKLHFVRCLFRLLLGGMCIIVGGAASGCGAHVVVVYSGSAEQVERATSIFDELGVATHLSSSDGRATLAVSAVDEQRAIQILRILDRYMPSSPDSSPILESYFLPRAESGSSAELVSGLERIIMDVQYIRAARCRAERISTTVLSCSVLLEKGAPHDEVKKMLQEIPHVLEMPVMLTLGEFDAVFGNVLTVSRSIDAPQLVVLDPFSFHVPKTETWLASSQLIVLLAIFLISGLILGFVFSRLFRGDKLEY